MQEKEITAFVKYNMFDKEQNSNYNSKHPFSQDKLFYNQEKDCYICPMGQEMLYIGDSKRKTATGFEQTSRKYQAQNCSNCPLNGVCHKSKTNRVIEINVNLKKLKHKPTSYSIANKALRGENKDVTMLNPYLEA